MLRSSSCPAAAAPCGRFTVRPSEQSGRTLNTIAVGFLGLDGVLLGLAAVWTHRLSLGIMAGVSMLAAALVVLYYRSHRRSLGEIAGVQAEMQAEMRALKDA